MATFYRLQSKEYNINSESRSFLNCYESPREAMEETIKEWAVGCESDGNWINLDDYKVMNQEIKEIYEIYENLPSGWDEVIKEIYNNLLEKGYETNRIHAGVSCYENKEDLIKYFEYHRSCNSNNIVDAYNDDYYILVFEGENVGVGPDGEDLAIFEREIERVSVSKFIKEN